MRSRARPLLPSEPGRVVLFAWKILALTDLISIRSAEHRDRHFPFNCWALSGYDGHYRFTERVLLPPRQHHSPIKAASRVALPVVSSAR